MSKENLPYLKEETIERRAMAMLREAFNEDAPYQPGPVDIYRVAEFHIGAILEYQRLSTDGSILGLSVMRDGHVPICNEAGEQSMMEMSENTIVIDHLALADSPECRERFTVAHEIGHLHLHKKYFCNSDSVLAPIKAHRAESIAEQMLSEMLSRSAEWQANRFGAALLMPRPAFKAAMKQELPSGWSSLPEGDGQEKRDFLEMIAAVFQVSPEAAAIRMKDLGLQY